MTDTRKTERVKYLEHLISVHGATPQEAPTFDHDHDHDRGTWGHDLTDYFTWEAGR